MRWFCGCAVLVGLAGGWTLTMPGEGSQTKEQTLFDGKDLQGWKFRGGEADKDLKYGDCGGIYNTAPPRTNASKAPGEWQSFDVIFQAPRFDAQGKKTANAKFVKVVHNGMTVHENVEVQGPTTASLGPPE